MTKTKLLILLLLLMGSGCAANKSNIDYLKKEPPCPIQYNYGADYTSVWQATIRALAEEEIIKTMNQDVGIVVTEFGTVDDFELNAIDTVMGAKTYKYSYTINLRKSAPTNTQVSIKTNLKMNQIALYEREQKIPWVESYLRRKLFIRICKQLTPGKSNKCRSLFARNQQSPHFDPSNTSDDSQSGRILTKSQDLLFRVQKELNTNGYSAGSQDGFMGPKTRAAIKKFQRDKKLPITGRPDSNTLIALGLKQGSSEKKILKQVVKTPKPKPTSNTEKAIQVSSDTELMRTKDPFSGTNMIIPQKSVLKVKSKEADWYKVQYQDRTGYIHSSFVMDREDMDIAQQPPIVTQNEKQDKRLTIENKKPSEVGVDQQNGPFPEQPTAKEDVVKPVDLGVGKVTESTSLLSEPSFMADTIQGINAGQKIELLDKKEDFYKILLKGKEGYIYADFIEVIR